MGSIQEKIERKKFRDTAPLKCVIYTIQYVKYCQLFVIKFTLAFVCNAVYSVLAGVCNAVYSVLSIIICL